MNSTVDAQTLYVEDVAEVGASVFHSQRSLRRRQFLGVRPMPRTTTTHPTYVNLPPRRGVE